VRCTVVKRGTGRGGGVCNHDDVLTHAAITLPG
jgi:hypothetical protein